MPEEAEAPRPGGASLEDSGERSTAHDSQAPSWPSWERAVADGALHGLAGELVRTLKPHTEADPAAILVQLLVCYGNVIGRRAHFTVEADKHYLNLYAVVVGTTSKGRKGTSWGQVRHQIEMADPGWRQRVASGLSSGEGLIWHVRDRTDEDDGVQDKRLLVHESEFASVLKVMGREGNTLSPVLRDAWDTGDLQTLTKSAPAEATGAHISLVAHVTAQELRRRLDATEAANGFGNRFSLGLRAAVPDTPGGRLAGLSRHGTGDIPTERRHQGWSGDQADAPGRGGTEALARGVSRAVRGSSRPRWGAHRSRGGPSNETGLFVRSSGSFRRCPHGAPASSPGGLALLRGLGRLCLRRLDR
jgi:hypothetical protein